MNHTPRLIAFDLDGTLSQYRTPMEEQNRRVLERLSLKYELVMVSAGTCRRVFAQMNRFPINILGNYGMQTARYNPSAQTLEIVSSAAVPVDREEAFRRAAIVRKEFGLHHFSGDTLEIHPTGMMTFPVLGTSARIEDKLAYDPNRSKRRAMYAFIRDVFCDYRVVLGGSSSFDIVPYQYGKYNALTRYLTERGLSKKDAVYCGDEYEEGGNDHDVLTGGVPFIRVDSYKNLETLLAKEGLLS